MAQAHVSELNLQGSVVSSLKEGAAFSMIADADLATDLATTLANIATRNAKLLAGQRADQIARYYALVEAVKVGFRELGSTLMTGGSLANVYAAVPGTWQAGFGIAV